VLAVEDGQHRDLHRGQGAPLRSPRSRGRGWTARYGPVRWGRSWRGVRHRWRGCRSLLDLPRGGCWRR
jgi:hypothetical protein